jgi:hypothetical protein
MTVSIPVWFTGGLLVGLIAPGGRFVEPVAAAFLVALPTAFFLYQGQTVKWMPAFMYVLMSALGVLFALIGAFLGERLQLGPPPKHLDDRSWRRAGAPRGAAAVIAEAACRGRPGRVHRAEAGRGSCAPSRASRRTQRRQGVLATAWHEASCSAPDLCRLRDDCLGAYRRHVAALEEKDALARALAAGTPAPDATTRLDAVERMLDEARDGALDCSRRELAIRARYRP